MRRLAASLALAVLWSGGVVSAQNPPEPLPRPLPLPGSFLDPVAEALYLAAQNNWVSVNRSVSGYTARIQQRLAAAIRAPSRDRTVFRQESAVRAFWAQGEDARVQLLASRRQLLSGPESWRDGGDWLNALTFEHPFEPGGERLFFGMEEQLQEEFFPGEESFWLVHPLAPGSDTLFQYQSGDTLTLSLPDGRRLQTIQLHVLPREPDPRLITGTLWIDPESGGLVRAVYRLSRPLDATRDLPELKDGTRDVRFDLLPGFAKPWTIDLTLVAMDYTLWDFQIWLPRSMRVEGEGRAGEVTFPFSLDAAYELESVILVGAEDQPGQMEIPEDSFQDRDGVRYELIPQVRESGRRRSRILVPVDRTLLASGPYLPPPIWEEAPQFATEEELREMAGVLQGIGDKTRQKVAGTTSWGWGGQDLLRYNRVEGLAVGGRFGSPFGSPLGLLHMELSVFLGLADLEPKARLSVEQRSVSRRLTVGVFRELQATQRRGRYLAVGNSLNALLFGRDYGEYYLATGVDLVWRSPEGRRQLFEIRAYGERQEGLENQADFSMAHALESDWQFRPNVTGDLVEEVGAHFHLTPAWGRDAAGPQVGLNLYGQGATWRAVESTERGSYGRASALARLSVPLTGAGWRVGVEVGGGTTAGQAPTQRRWFLGGPGSLRGYDAGYMSGTSFTRGRLELGRSSSAWGLAVFSDAGWAGRSEDFRAGDMRYGVGVGASLLDGLFRMDFCRGLTGPGEEFRVELYLDAIL